MKIQIKLPGRGEIVFEKEPGNGDWQFFLLALAGIVAVSAVFITMFSSI